MTTPRWTTTRHHGCAIMTAVLDGYAVRVVGVPRRRPSWSVCHILSGDVASHGEGHPSEAMAALLTAASTPHQESPMARSLTEEDLEVLSILLRGRVRPVPERAAADREALRQERDARLVLEVAVLALAELADEGLTLLEDIEEAGGSMPWVEQDLMTVRDEMTAAADELELAASDEDEDEDDKDDEDQPSPADVSILAAANRMLEAKLRAMTAERDALRRKAAAARSTLWVLRVAAKHGQCQELRRLVIEETSEVSDG